MHYVTVRKYPPLDSQWELASTDQKISFVENVLLSSKKSIGYGGGGFLLVIALSKLSRNCIVQSCGNVLPGKVQANALIHEQIICASLFF
jgi:hypothetical protein